MSLPVRLIAAVFLSAGLFSSSGCAQDDGTWVEVAGARYEVEVADDEEERRMGLMFRESLPEDRGMIFVHPDSRRLAYWMKNTRIPLDILYFDEQRRLVSQQRNVPPCAMGDGCPSYPSTGPARYVLELNAGQAAKLGLEDGATITFGPGVPERAADAQR